MQRRSSSSRSLRVPGRCPNASAAPACGSERSWRRSLRASSDNNAIRKPDTDKLVARYRHRTLPELWRRLEDHRRPFDWLRTGIEDPPVIVRILIHLGLPTRAPPRPAGAAIRFIPNGLRAETGYQRKPSPPLGLSSSERCDLKHFARLRLLRRPSQQKQHRDFHQTEKGLTTPRSGDIARSRKKVV